MHKVLHVIWSSGKIGGIERHILSLTKKLDKTKYNITVCILGSEGIISGELRKIGINVKIIPTKGGFDIMSALRFYIFLRKNRFDLIHSHVRILLPGFCLSLGTKGCAHIVTEHIATEDEPFLCTHIFRKIKLFYRIFLSDYTKIIAVSEATRDALINKIGISSRRILRIPHGIDANKFNIVCDINDINKKKEKLRIPLSSKVVGTVGHLENSKGVNYFIEAAKELLKQRQDTEFLIVGDGSLRSQLERKTETLGLTPKVRFLGYRRDILELLAIMDIFLFTSNWESFGIVLLEAMAMGVPTAGFNVGAASEIIVNGETGILIARRDPILLAKVTIKLLEDESCRNAMARKGRERVRSCFSLDRMVEKIEGLYESLLH